MSAQVAKANKISITGKLDANTKSMLVFKKKIKLAIFMADFSASCPE